MSIIPATQEAEIRRVWIQDQPDKKLVRPSSQRKKKTLGMVACATCYPNYLGGIVQADSGGKNTRPYLKNN
jgi:hypothetical protein